MSINHAHLKRLVAEMEQGVAATTQYSWLDLAQEILRMREELTNLQEAARHVEKNYELDPNAQRAFDSLEDTINQILEGEDFE